MSFVIFSLLQLVSMKAFSFENSAFKVVHKPNENIFEVLESFVQKLLSERKEMNIHEHEFSKQLTPTIRFLSDTLFTLVKECKSSENEEESEPDISYIFQTLQIPLNLIRDVFSLIQSKLIRYKSSHKFDDQLTQSMLFDKGFFNLFKACICNQRNAIKLKTLNCFYDKIKGKFSHQMIAEEIYSLHGGTYLTIQQSNFFTSLKYVIHTIGKIFTSTNNFINRNFIIIRKEQKSTKIIESSIKIICNYQNTNFIENQIKQLTQLIFDGQSFLTRADFIKNTQKVINHSMLWLYPDLLTVQTYLLESPSFKKEVLKRQKVQDTNFYTQQMQKLLKKCPYNGDERCDCKKCNCVRRNRESAKLSQEKKRNAVEQIGPLQQRIQVLEKRNILLEEENKVLKSIMSQLMKKGQFKDAFQSTIEPISKILNNE